MNLDRKVVVGEWSRRRGKVNTDKNERKPDMPSTSVGVEESRAGAFGSYPMSSGESRRDQGKEAEPKKAGSNICSRWSQVAIGMCPLPTRNLMTYSSTGWPNGTYHLPDSL
ncbi:hypothetical protein J6590_009257 [Homalodisca vitripennis]|nr:hypothetical protein J6590_009257 [Homalodisca vitripennis]